MRILHCVETLHRNAGGLPVAVVEMAAAQMSVDKDCRTVIAASNAPGDIPRGESLAKVGAAVIQNRSAIQLSRSLTRQHCDENFTLVHQHGLWTPISLLSSRFARARRLPLVISPHGMLEPWARYHHALRKKVAWHVYQKRLLSSADALVASSETEAAELRTLGFHHDLAVISHGVHPVAAGEKRARSSDRRTLLMLSRLHAKKGIDLLLDAWATTDAPDWQLIIAGNDEGGTRAELERQVARLGIGNRVTFQGAVFGEQKDELFRDADLFVLPSHSENFGIVVAEALQHGLPVITTTGTPWRHLATENCGWCVPASSSDLGVALGQAINLSDEDRCRMGERARALIERDHCWKNIAASYLQLYRWLNDRDNRPQPECL